MSNNVFVVSEWLPKAGCEQALWECFKKLVAMTLENEKGCIIMKDFFASFEPR